MSNYILEIYESIVEASEIGELWEINLEQSQCTQLEIDFPSCVNS